MHFATKKIGFLFIQVWIPLKGIYLHNRPIRKSNNTNKYVRVNYFWEDLCSQGRCTN